LDPKQSHPQEATVFIQMVSGSCSQQEDMRMLVDDWCANMASQPGWLGGTYGFTDDGRFMGVVRYESAAMCRELCDAEGAGAWWAAAEQLFDGSPEIHQSQDVSIMLQGGSDDAGFVQIMRGKVANADMLRKMTTDQEMTSMMHEARPDIIGSTLIIEDDGTFTETIAFTDEESARIGEKKEMPADVAADFEGAISEVEYYDLHRPWFGRHE
jgi:hypothetical protein